MITSYDETSGFSLVSSEELTLVNGGKGSGGGGGGGSNKSDSKNRAGSTNDNIGGVIIGIGGISGNAGNKGPSINITKNISLSFAGLTINGKNTTTTISPGIQSFKPLSFSLSATISY